MPAGMSLWRRQRFGGLLPDRRRPAPDRPPPDPLLPISSLPDRSLPDQLLPDWSLPQLLDLLPHPVVALAPGGLLRHANASAQALLGDALPALLRHPLLVQALDRLHGAAGESVDLAMDVPVRRLLRVAMRADRRAGSGLILLSLADRTEQDAVERMRADFVANASHELRTPLASLIGFIETLQGPAADDAPARVRFLAIMEAQAARMCRLIDNLLSLSRIQMHEHRRPDGSVLPVPLLRRVADAHEPQLRAAGSTLAVEVADGLPPMAADPDQLAQVLHNLLDNAIKYAKGPARIVLRAAASQAGLGPAPGVVLSVSDDGPGIAPQHLPRLTERFYRADDGLGAKTGSGLGLAIVKHIVGRHGGRLAIESTPGQGTCVSVWLPVRPPGT